MRVLSWAIAAIIAISALPLSAQAQLSASEKKAESSASILGRVTADGEPAAGVRVVLIRENDNKPPEETVTDESGSYRFSSVAAGMYKVLPAFPGFYAPKASDKDGKIVALAEGETAEGIDLAFKRGGVVTGRISDNNGNPVIGKPIRLKTDLKNEGGFSELYGSHFSTDDRGVYRVYGLPPGRYLVCIDSPKNKYELTQPSLIYHPGVADEKKADIIDIEENEEEGGVDIVIDRSEPPEPSKTFKAAGRVVLAENGNPVPKISLNCYEELIKKDSQGNITTRSSYGRFFGFSDSKGEFLIKDLAPGRYAIRANLDDDGDLFPINIYFDIKDQDVSGLEIKLQRGAVLSGRIILTGTSDRAFFANNRTIGIFATVRAFNEDSDHNNYGNRAVVDADGGFRFTGMGPGSVSLSLTSDNKPKLHLLRVERDGADASKIEIGSENITGLRVFAGLGTGILRGQIKIEGGSLPEGTSLYLAYTNLSSGTSANSSADVDSRRSFYIEGLLPGDYELTVYNPINSKPVKKTVAVNENSVSEAILTLDLSPPKQEDDDEQDD